MKVQSESRFLTCQHSEIHYLVFGHGAEPLIAFHGFGENAATFEALFPSLAQKFTVYAVDFPFHGKTRWDSRDKLDKKIFSAWIEKLLDIEGINHFSVMGFSMGARMVMAALMEFKSRIHTVFLIAADGIKTHPVFNVAMYPGWGRFIFKKVMHNPRFFFQLLGLLYRFKLVSKFLYNFTRNHMDTPEKRQRIYFTWTTLKQFIPDIPAVKIILETEAIHSYLFFGQYDEVITPKTGRAFAKGLTYGMLQIVPHGHLLIAPFLNEYIDKALKV